MTQSVFYQAGDFIDLERWGIAGIAPETLDELWMSPPSLNPQTGEVETFVSVRSGLKLHIPGLDFVEIAVNPTAVGSTLGLSLTVFPFALSLKNVSIILRVDANILRPVKLNPDGTWVPDQTANTFDISLGTIDASLNIDTDVHLKLNNSAPSIPRCMIGKTGVILEIHKLQWITPTTPQDDLPQPIEIVPPGFTGLFLDDVYVEIPNFKAEDSLQLKMDYAFLGTGGFNGKIAPQNLDLTWQSDPANPGDPSAGRFTGLLAGELFGFKGGLSSLDLTFRQSALVGCTIAGDVFVPYLDKRVGLTLGLDGAGGITATAGPPRSVVDPPIANDPTQADIPRPGSGYLVHFNVRNLLLLDINELRFEALAGAPAALEISGQIKLQLPGFNAPPLGLRGIRINTRGEVEIKGGWINLEQAKQGTIHGFSLELSKFGFGSLDDGRRWVGVSGGLHLARGLPMGASVEGLRVVYDPRKTGTDFINSLSVTLKGVGLEVTVPGAFEFKGAVALDEIKFVRKQTYEEVTVPVFRGSIKLGLPTIGLKIDAELVIGKEGSDTFFYLYLAADLPVGIPLFNTGAAFYGFQGLVATNMGPDKRTDEPWYYGWYLRDPKGATSNLKWTVEPDAFAIGLGATLGTAPDNGFAWSAKALLILVFPGPRILLEGKASFLKKRPDSAKAEQQGEFEALLALDVPAKLFQANLSANYSVDKLLSLRGGADVAFTWADLPPQPHDQFPPQPPHDLWHVYLGEPQRRWQASLLSIFSANAYFQLWRTGIVLGARVDVKEDWTFGPARVWLRVSLDGEGEVSWSPAHYEGTLQLLGQAGISAFGASVEIALDSSVTARGPTPLFVRMYFQIGIKIDLWLFKFEFETSIELKWEERRPPNPIIPILDRVGWEHLKVDETGVLFEPDNPLYEPGNPLYVLPVIPPDGRPVMIFKRPMRDLGQIGAPHNPNTIFSDESNPSLSSNAATSFIYTPDKVGDVEFSYELVQVVLVRTDGGERVVAASGILNQSNDTTSLPGLSSLPDVIDGQLELDGSTFRVTGASAGTLTVTDTIPNGEHRYKLRGPLTKIISQIATSTQGPLSTGSVTLGTDPNVTRDAFSGGYLEAGGARWLILSNDGRQVTVRTPAESPKSGPTLPSVGSAELTALPGPVLRGVWLPASDKEPPATKLMLWARTPFAYFRRNDKSTITGWNGSNPDYICGPNPSEEPVCEGFDELLHGSLAGDFTTTLLSGRAEGPVLVSEIRSGDRYIIVGQEANGQISGGKLTLHFPSPIEWLQVLCSTREGGRLVTLLDGQEIRRVFIDQETQSIELSGMCDEVQIDGSGTDVWRICYLPGWTCIQFEAGRIPLNTDGVEIAGLTFVSQNPFVASLQEIVALSSSDRFVRLLLSVVGGEGMQSEAFNESVIIFSQIGGISAQILEQFPPHQSDLDQLQVLVRQFRNLWVTVEIDFPDELNERLREIINWVSQVANTTIQLEIVINSESTLKIRFPSPVTRARLKMRGREGAIATLQAFGELVEFDQQQSILSLDGIYVVINLAQRDEGWIDRIEITGLDLLLDELCYDGHEFAWKRRDQWTWQNGIQRSTELLYGEDPVLSPGEYRLDLAIRVKTSGATSNEVWRQDSIPFKVGQPPGLGSGEGERYPDGGLLNDLATYIDSTLPSAGERPLYRAYDLGVAFSANYVSRLFLAAGSQLHMVVVDSNQTDRRAGTRNVWDRRVQLALSQEDEAWIGTLHASDAQPCANVDTTLIMRNETLQLGAGELLAPNQLHAAEVRSATKSEPIYRFEFVTSRFANFVQHLIRYDGLLHYQNSSVGSAPDLTTEVSVVRVATDALTSTGNTFKQAEQAINSGSPSAVQFDAYHQRRAALSAAHTTLPDAMETAFQSAWKKYGLTAPSSLPEHIEITGLPGAFLIGSPEPMHPSRLSITIARSDSLPLRRRVLTFTDENRRKFGAPDIGEFTYAGLKWTTDAELRVLRDAVDARLEGSLTLEIELPNVQFVEVIVRVQENGNVTLRGIGSNLSEEVTQGTTGESTATLGVTGSPITEIILTGNNYSLVSLIYVEPFLPSPFQGLLRLVGATLPNVSNDTNHFVEVMSYGDTNLTGWSLFWHDALNPRESLPYYRFEAGTLPEGRLARIYGGKTSGEPAPSADTYFAQDARTLSTSGNVFQLVDPNGQLVHEIAVMSAYQPVAITGIVPNGDGTRIFVLIVSGDIKNGHWRLNLTLKRDAGPALPIWSVGSDTSDESVGLFFQ